MSIEVHRAALAGQLVGREIAPSVDDVQHNILLLECPMSLRRRGVETRMILTNNLALQRLPDAALVNLLARAHRYLDQLTEAPGRTQIDVARTNCADAADVSRILPLAFLSPEITAMIMIGSQPVGLTTQRLLRIGELPSSWSEQATLLGI